MATPPITSYEQGLINDAIARLQEQAREFDAKQAQDLAMFNQTQATDAEKQAFAERQAQEQLDFQKQQFSWAQSKFQTELGWDQQKFNATMGLQLQQLGLDTAKFEQAQQKDDTAAIQAYRDELSKETGPKDVFRYLFNVRGQSAPQGYQSTPLPIPPAVQRWYQSQGIDISSLTPQGNNSLVTLRGQNNVSNQSMLPSNQGPSGIASFNTPGQGGPSGIASFQNPQQFNVSSNLGPNQSIWLHTQPNNDSPVGYILPPNQQVTGGPAIAGGTYTDPGALGGVTSDQWMPVNVGGKTLYAFLPEVQATNAQQNVDPTQLGNNLFQQAQNASIPGRTGALSSQFSASGLASMNPSGTSPFNQVLPGSGQSVPPSLETGTASAVGGVSSVPGTNTNPFAQSSPAGSSPFNQFSPGSTGTGSTAGSSPFNQFGPGTAPTNQSAGSSPFNQMRPPSSQPPSMLPSSSSSTGFDFTNPANLPPGLQGLVGPQGQITIPSMQQWNNLLPTEQDAYQSYVQDVAGGEFQDVDSQMKALAPIASNTSQPTTFK